LFHDFFPIFILLAAFAVSALTSERAIAQLSPEARSVLVAAAARTRVIALGVLGIFVALMAWRPIVAWVFLGGSFLGLGVRMTLRLRRLRFPPRAARLLLAGQWTGVGGIEVVSVMYAMRAGL
jgi:hypothetical protein